MSGGFGPLVDVCLLLARLWYRPRKLVVVSTQSMSGGTTFARKRLFVSMKVAILTWLDAVCRRGGRRGQSGGQCRCAVECPRELESIAGLGVLCLLWDCGGGRELRRVEVRVEVRDQFGGGKKLQGNTNVSRHAQPQHDGNIDALKGC